MPVLTNNMNDVPRLIILRGSPGVGKSTIATKVARLNSAKKKTCISIDNFQLYDFRNMCRDREKLAIRNAALLTKNFLSEGFDVVVDYVFDDPNDFIYFTSFMFNETLCKLPLVYTQFFYLDAPIETVLKRNQSRSGKRGEYMNVPLLRKIYARISETKGKIEHEVVIDSTKYSAKQCAKFILSYRGAYKNNESYEITALPKKDLARSLEKEE